MRTSNISDLIDVSTGNETLGPDLDPFLYLRNAIELSNGNANEIDSFRYAPLNQTPSYITNNLMPWAILGAYNLLSIFMETSVTYASIILPVILFLISAIGFLLFARTISSFKFSKEKSWIISLIATAFYIVIPTMLHRNFIWGSCRDFYRGNVLDLGGLQIYLPCNFPNCIINFPI
jgi:hypothetical protein